MPTALVTGASRGLGLEWVRQLLADGWQVTATCRDPSRAHALGAVTEQHPEQAAITALDVDDPADVRAAVARVGQRVERLDLVVSNAGIWADPARESEASAGPLASLDAEAVQQVLRTNAVGALSVAQVTAPLLAGGGVLAHMTSGLGSLARATFVACHAYQVSKAALNMATRLLAVELADDDITVVALDPGWVRTELGGAGARLDPEESVAGLRGVVASLSREQSGQVLNRRGEPVAF
jgi:NAD(P)-dependent dehydrogenase (short-subunit alcohol dehydrogenase family)